MHDLDGLRMLDTTKVSLDTDGTVKGVDDLIKEAQKNKAYLFKPTQTSSTAKAPSNTEPNGKTDPKDLKATDEAAFLRGLG